MSSLNLTPDPQLMFAQATIFIANMYVVKRYLINPFMKIKEQRDALTDGSEHEAVRLEQESAEMLKTINEKIASVRQQCLEAQGEQERVLGQKRQTEFGC